jgi:hypothetical protein
MGGWPTHEIQLKFRVPHLIPSPSPSRAVYLPAPKAFHHEAHRKTSFFVARCRHAYYYFSIDGTRFLALENDGAQLGILQIETISP